MYNLAIAVSYTPIEFFTLENNKIFGWFKDATFSGDRSRSINIITGNHSYSDTSFLTLSNSIRYLEKTTRVIAIFRDEDKIYLRTNRIFDTDNT